MARAKPTWIVVMDGARARFFALKKTDDGQLFEELQIPLAARPKPAAKSGRPGRVFSSARGGPRHALEPASDPGKLEKHNFTREVAQALQGAFAARSYGQLVLAAPPRSLGEVRELLPPALLARLMLEVPKDYTKLPPDALWTKLSGHLVNAATPRIGEKKDAAARAADGAGAPPVAVAFRNMTPSPAIRSAVLKLAAGLTRSFGRITNCRVTIEAPPRHREKGKNFKVAVEASVPGRTIAARNRGDHTHEDVYVALRDTFTLVTRQLHAHARRMKGPVAQGRRSSSLSARRLD